MPNRPRPTRSPGLPGDPPSGTVFRSTRDAPASVRGRRQRKVRPLRINHRMRGRVALFSMLVLLVAATVKLVMIQTVDAAGYAAQATAQRDHTITLPAVRGTIYDRNGTPLAFTVSGDAIAARPALFKSDTERHEVADLLASALGPAVTADGIMTQLTDGKYPYVYLARGLMPAQAADLMAKITKDGVDPNAVVTERQDLRQYPQGTITQSLLGATGWDGHGTGGVEIKYDSLLGGTDGSRTVDLDPLGRPIPGTDRDETAAVDGGNVSLTIDADLQYTVVGLLHQTIAQTGSRGGSALVMSVKDAEVYAMASEMAGKDAAEVGNMAITAPFEPGSVAKVITFGAALQKGLITPTTHFAVPDHIEMGGHIVHDAWGHVRVGMTAAGILGKSSNVGTLMIAQQVGEDAFFDQLTKFGLGSKTGIQLPADSAGSVPPLSQWSATSFANMPIGQGLSVTLLQLADMYQSIANGGMRIPPTLVAATEKDGITTPAPKRTPTRALSAKSAHTLVDMLRATVQGGSMAYDGTAPKAALTGYQIAGKTGTAQQVDPKCGCYSNTLVNATFAGILPADNPQFVIAVMLDAPAGGAEAGGAAAPLFHDIAAYVARAFDVQPSKSKPPIYTLYTNMGE
jgi:cell division protein FtsI (penicillin-binding protein 3)